MRFIPQISDFLGDILRTALVSLMPSPLGWGCPSNNNSKSEHYVPPNMLFLQQETRVDNLKAQLRASMRVELFASYVVPRR